MKLTNEQTIILGTLAKNKLAKTFYWTGGTLLAHYYLHHRKSFDIDLFSDTAFAYEDLIPFLDDVKKSFGVSHLVESRIYDRWDFLVPGVVPPLRFEFVHYNHEKKRLAPLGRFMDISIDSLPDMAANKVMAYIDRNQPKDLLDVYALLTQKKFTVSELLSMVEQKFGSRFSELLFWSESAKGLKELETLKPYLLEQDEQKQDALVQEIKYFFLDHGKNFFAGEIEASK